MKAMLILSSFCFLLTACGGNSLEDDVRKTARLRCEMQHLREKISEGDKEAEEELKETQKEYEAFETAMEEKYKDLEPDDERKDEMGRIYEEELKKCTEDKKD